MHRVALVLVVLLALAIIAVGNAYLWAPRSAMRSFGLPLPEEGPHLAGWLRLKGVRDIVAGLTVMTALVFFGTRAAGTILLVETLIPVGDMLVILASRGSARQAYSIHGMTALVMLLAAVPLITGGT